jgi:glycosyltransferase involved in cell wall biosynthesis
VFGWIGSFRRFHALDLAVDAVARIDGAALLLMGDGPERAAVEAHARSRGVTAVTTGTVPYAELPAYFAAMDAGVVVAGRDTRYHYSPLKLAEYLAAGLPVVAPRVEQIEARLTDGDAALLVPPGDADALAAALARLADAEVRATMAARAVTVATSFSWDEQVRRVLGALEPAPA